MQCYEENYLGQLHNNHSKSGARNRMRRLCVVYQSTHNCAFPLVSFPPLYSSLQIISNQILGPVPSTLNRFSLLSSFPTFLTAISFRVLTPPPCSHLRRVLSILGSSYSSRRPRCCQHRQILRSTTQDPSEAHSSSVMCIALPVRQLSEKFS